MTAIQGTSYSVIPRETIIRNAHLLTPHNIQTLGRAVLVNENTNRLPGLQDCEKIPIILIDNSIPEINTYNDTERGLSGIYYLTYSKLEYPNALFSTSLERMKQLCANNNISRSDIQNAQTQATFDYLLEHNSHAQALHTQGRDDLVRLVARAQVTQAHNDKKAILLAYCELAKIIPTPTSTMISFSTMVTSLTDVNLQNAMSQVVQRICSADRVNPNFDDIIAQFDRREYVLR